MSEKLRKLRKERTPKLTEEILEKLYSTAGLEVPTWVWLRPDIEVSDPSDEWRGMILELIDRYVADVLSKYARKEDLQYNTTTYDRIAFISSNNIPSSILLVRDRDGSESVVIKRGFLKYLAENGINIASLRDLAELMDWNYSRIHSRKSNINVWAVKVDAEFFRT